MKLISTALGLIILVSFGCNRSHYSQGTEKKIEWAYQLIDQGYYTESIDLFLNILQEEDTPTVRLGLASAYAARAGIHVHTYWDLVLPSVKAKPPATFESTTQFKKIWNEKIDQLPADLKKDLGPKSEEILRAHHQMETLKWRFQKIPVISTEEQNTDLVMARSYIKGLRSKGARLYRALLGLILIRHEVTKSSDLLKLSLEANQEWPCTPALKAWFRHLSIPLNLVSDLLVDIKVAYPNKMQEIAPFEKDFEGYHEKIVTSLNVMDATLCANH